MLAAVILSLVIGTCLLSVAFYLAGNTEEPDYNKNLEIALKDPEVASIMLKLSQLKNLSMVDRRVYAKSNLLKARLKHRVPCEVTQRALLRIVDRMK